MKKYLTGNWRELIKEVETERETDSSVWINGNRFAKDSKYEKYHNTFKEAKAFLLKGAMSSIRATRKQLEQEEKRFETIQNLTE
tara:strand:- start:98 stop:349 length:252 start_codon:yes stop_codon:yes gene_type:complete